MNVISLVVFGGADRYWNSLTAALLGYAELYPGFELHLYYSSDAVAHPFFPFVRQLASRTGRIELVHVDREYTGNEPTLWRMLPLWNSSVDLLLCRDIDSTPTSEELRAVRVFSREEAPPIHGIRGHPLHHTLLLAGLCGFKNRRLGFLRQEIGCFEHYWHIYARLNLRGRWGCDQQMLRVALGCHARQILDSPFGSARALDRPVVTLAPAVYEAVNLDDLPVGMLQICDRMSRYPGQPHNDARPYLRMMLELDTPVVSAFREVLDGFPRVKRELLG